MDQVENMLHLQDIIGNTSTVRQGVRISHFQQWPKSFSSREAHPGSDRSTAHRGRSRKSNINKTWITGGLDEVESTVAIANMGRTVVEGPV